MQASLAAAAMTDEARGEARVNERRTRRGGEEVAGTEAKRSEGARTEEGPARRKNGMESGSRRTRGVSQ